MTANCSIASFVKPYVCFVVVFVEVSDAEDRNTNVNKDAGRACEIV